MDTTQQYLMENPQEALRLDVKTDPDAVRRQAALCGIGPGVRVLDGGADRQDHVGDHEIVQPGGSAVGIDFAGTASNSRRSTTRGNPASNFGAWT